MLTMESIRPKSEINIKWKRIASSVRYEIKHMIKEYINMDTNALDHNKIK
jgi:hypothetical protein